MTRERIRLARAAVARVRPHADAFAEAVLGGARALARRDADGRLRFRSEPVAELHEELREALAAAFGDRERTLIEARTGRPFDGFLDQVVMGWLRAEPSIVEFIAPDRRGSGGFVFEVVRADLHEVGLDLEVEPRPRGWRIVSVPPGRRAFAPLLGGTWLGALAGIVVEAAGVPGATLAGFAAGLLLGATAALRMWLVRPPPVCSECGATAGPEAWSCAGCGTRFSGDLPSGTAEPDPDERE